MVVFDPQRPTRLKRNDEPPRLRSTRASNPEATTAEVKKKACPPSQWDGVKIAKTVQNHGPQYPAGQSIRPPTAGRDPRV
ncbi:unnamed protein product [Toxocara canis]|uniref:Uncharacterized protein n=1 Tax=Toxocara canis TaxID=6265 RepID=A0A183VHC3_TOXCA|nr:unnamed protein product [Toxocara canis]